MNDAFLLKKIFKKLYQKINHYKKRNYLGQNNIDYELKRYLDFKNGFFIEIGAYDGITYSNTYNLEKNKKWTGLLVEPTKENFELCKANRPNSKVFNYVCVPFGFNLKEVDFTDVGLMSYSEQLSNDLNIKQHRLDAIKHIESIGKKEKIYKVKTVDLDSLLNKINAPKIINFFSLDVEGSEMAVLDGFNFDEYIIEYLFIESRDIDKIAEYLQDKDYILIKEFHEFESTQQLNLLFKHSSVN